MGDVGEGWRAAAVLRGPSKGHSMRRRRARLCSRAGLEPGSRSPQQRLNLSEPVASSVRSDGACLRELVEIIIKQLSAQCLAWSKHPISDSSPMLIREEPQ